MKKALGILLASVMVVSQSPYFYADEAAGEQQPADSVVEEDSADGQALTESFVAQTLPPETESSASALIEDSVPDAAPVGADSKALAQGAPASATALTLNAEVTATLDSSNSEQYFKFTPPAGGSYSFISTNNNSQIDPLSELYEYNGSDLESIGSSDDEAYDDYHNFLLIIDLKAGTDYYLKVTEYRNQDTSFGVKVLRTLDLPLSLEYDSTVYIGSAQTRNLTVSERHAIPATFQWYKDVVTGSPIQTDVQTTSSSLTVNGQNISPASDSHYLCVVFNTANPSSAPKTLDITVKNADAVPIMPEFRDRQLIQLYSSNTPTLDVRDNSGCLTTFAWYKGNPSGSPIKTDPDVSSSSLEVLPTDVSPAGTHYFCTLSGHGVPVTVDILAFPGCDYSQPVSQWKDLASPISSGTVCSIQTPVNNYASLYKFTAPVTSVYTFRSYDNTEDPVMQLYDQDLNEVVDYTGEMDDEDGNNKNFQFDAPLTAGKTYYLALSDYGDGSSYSFTVEHKTHDGTWSTQTPATVFSPEIQVYRCGCGYTQTRTAGSKLSPAVALNVSGLIPLALKQNTGKIVFQGLAAGDSVSSWISSNPKVATVDGKGKITGKKKGTAVITVTTAAGASASVTIKVQKKAVQAKSISVASKSVILTKGQAFSLDASVSPITVKSKITYKSSNKKIVSVNKRGIIKAKKKGKATVTAKCGKKKVKVKVTVR